MVNSEYMSLRQRGVMRCNNLTLRAISSLVFLPIVISLFFISEKILCFLCVAVSLLIVKEIFFSKITGYIVEKILAFVVSLLGLISFIYCNKIHGIDGNVFLVTIASFTDIGAYCVGSVFRGIKLCPKISPNKTWAGLFGGVVVANIVFLLIDVVFCKQTSVWMFGDDALSSFLIVQLIIFASIVGDLLESSFKRRIQVKDMGKILPGHGGVLDRLDSLLFASIVFALFTILNKGT